VSAAIPTADVSNQTQLSPIAERKLLPMKTYMHGASILVAMVVLAVAGFTGGALNAGATAAIDHVSTIAEQVQHKLGGLPYYSVFDNIDYQVNGSEVILSGQVIGEHSQTKYDATREVESIGGVTKVVNNITILPLSPFDTDIRQAEYRAIYSQFGPGMYPDTIHIIVNNGNVTLEGVVINTGDRNAAGIAANTVPNVFSVTNNLRITPGQFLSRQ
jgi:osmotically-inducible protein OsmY